MSLLGTHTHKHKHNACRSTPLLSDSLLLFILVRGSLFSHPLIVLVDHSLTSYRPCYTFSTPYNRVSLPYSSSHSSVFTWCPILLSTFSAFLVLPWGLPLFATIPSPFFLPLCVSSLLFSCSSPSYYLSLCVFDSPPK